MENAKGASHTRLDLDAYRPDVDGLRGVAVLGVVSFHLGLNGGGFAGVDVFFVISGFLITRILSSELASGKPGAAVLASFYERRIRRILPAVALMCIVTFAVATLWLFPDDLKEFGRSLQSVAVFISNVHFQRKTGYFEGAADEKPLLHTWSLAVEEQYYLLFPLALWLVWRTSGQAVAFVVCLVVAVASLFYGEIQTQSKPELAFFSTPSRIWELLTGALLAMASERLPTTRALREIMAVVGVTLIAWTYAMYSSATSFPGLGAFLPVLGASLLIAAGVRGQTLVSRALAMPVLVGVGLISYSVYLWHWPLLVFAKYRFAPLMEQHTTLISALLFAASLLLGYFSWRFVEQPFRRRSSTQGRRQVFAVQAGLMLVMVLAGVALSRLDGLPGRWPNDILAILEPVSGAQASQHPSCRPAEPGRFDNIQVCDRAGGVSASSGPVLLWGDSHAKMLSKALAQHANEDQIFLQAISPGCPPLIDVEIGGRSHSAKCRRHNAAVVEYLAQEATPRVRTVFLVARWPFYAEGTRMPYERGRDVILGGGAAEDARHVLREKLTATVRNLLKHVDSVVLLKPFPEFDRSVATGLARAHAWGHLPLKKKTRSAVARRQASSLEAIDQAISLDPNRIKALSPLSYLCDELVCDFADAEGRPLFTDTNHLSTLGVARVVPLLKKMLAASGVPRA